MLSHVGVSWVRNRKLLKYATYMLVVGLLASHMKTQWPALLVFGVTCSHGHA